MCEAEQKAKHSPQFAASYQTIARRRGTKVATTAIARKLLTRAYHLLADMQDPNKTLSPKAEDRMSQLTPEQRASWQTARGAPPLTEPTATVLARLFDPPTQSFESRWPGVEQSPPRDPSLRV